MKYLVCTRGVPQRVRGGVWFTPVQAEYELSKEQLAAVEADPMLSVKPIAAGAMPARESVAPKEKKSADK